MTTSTNKIETLRAEIAKHQAELDKELALQEFLIAHPIYALAEDLHSALCSHDHTDQCDWYYCTWTDFASRGRYSSRVRYADLAARLQQSLGQVWAETVVQIFLDWKRG